MKISKLKTIIVPRWIRLTALTALALVTVLLVVSQLVQLAPSFSVTTNNRVRLAELEDNEVTLNLALEFGFDPMIVQLTRQLSKQAMQKHHYHPDQITTTWRFVRTDYDLTYLILSIVQTESRGDYKAVSYTHALGLTQLLLSTARHYNKDITEGELLTIPGNLTIAVEHFVNLLERYHGNQTLAILAWNQGAGGVDRMIALGNSPENGYARAVYAQAAMRNALR